MKPPPRKRTKPDRNLKPEQVPQRPGTVVSKWQQAELRRLLRALRKLSGTAGALSDIDYALLTKSVPTRSIAEIQSVVETLKNKAISCASFKLKKKKWEENKIRKPIEVWTHMASAVAGTLEESISSAFSQMLIVSSTEPRTLRNCDPPQVHRPPTQEDRLADRTVPLRPMPSLPGERPATNTARPHIVLKTPAPTMGPAKRLPAPSQVFRVTNTQTPPLHQQLSASSGSLPAATSQSAAPSCQRPPPSPLLPAAQTVTLLSSDQAAAALTVNCSSAAAIKSLSDGSSVNQTNQQTTEKKHTSSLHTSSYSLAPSAVPSSAASTSSATSKCSNSTHPKPQLSTPAAAVHARFGRTSKYATKDSPRTLGVKCVVDFERIYRYLSVIHKPSHECHLTPMESAIVLDLLMSLPEELPLLDCNKLHNHLIQVFQGLSAPADSSVAREMFEVLKTQKQGSDEPHTAGSQDRPAAQTETTSVRDCNPKPQQDSSRSNSQLDVTDSSDVTDSGGKKLQPDESKSQSHESNNTSSQTGGENMKGPPPLNPFMVPLKLLMRR
ncbi:snRNA-activating protein complex subunit 2 [Scomber scombrus]|uniref:snRNA-activating protein complex subunit 2 n=1 Tax=Scomber scombrus TaxID=13677 RepID=A0AAV1Q1F9_SCOSC